MPRTHRRRPDSSVAQQHRKLFRFYNWIFLGVNIYVCIAALPHQRIWLHQVVAPACDPRCENRNIERMTQKEHVLNTHPHTIQVHTGSRTEEWRKERLPTEHHTITTRQDDTGSEVTSIHLCIFTLVSSLILWYAILLPGRIIITQLQRKAKTQRLLIFPRGSAWLFQFYTLFVFCTNVDMNTPTHRLTPTVTWLTQREALESRNK